MQDKKKVLKNFIVISQSEKIHAYVKILNIIFELFKINYLFFRQ